jgi:hypothetical protein
MPWQSIYHSGDRQAAQSRRKQKNRRKIKAIRKRRHVQVGRVANYLNF